MSTFVINSAEFRAITGSNPSESTYTTEGNRAGISNVAKRVISYLQDVGNKSVVGVDVFIEKVGLIDAQFQEAELGTPFATDIAAVELLLGLREGLSSDYAELISNPFILELSELDGIERPVEVAKSYTLFWAGF